MRDVFHRRRLWRIQAMENAEGWHGAAVTEGVVPARSLLPPLCSPFLAVSLRHVQQFPQQRHIQPENL